MRKCTCLRTWIKRSLPLMLFATPLESPDWSHDTVSALGQDDEQALAPSRVLIAIAIGLARSALARDASKVVIKAAAVRPR